MSRIKIPGTYVADYALQDAPQGSVPSRLILLLHGYQHSGAYILKKLGSALPQDAVVLAPCGPFPMPLKKESRYVPAYCWYFYDPYRDEYVIDMEIAIDYLGKMLQALQLEALPKTIIGFSQGGYLAPFVASKLLRVERVVGIACRFLDEEIEKIPSYLLDQIHGEKDEIVPAAEAKKSHDRLVLHGAQGRFQLLPECGHEMNSKVCEALSQLLA